METAPLKSFATWARTALIREVTARITVVSAPASPERVEQPRRVEALQKAVDAAGGNAKGRAAVADRVAYTWFNRIIALRFMDANGYTGIGVVSPQAGVASGQPEILAEAKRGQFDTDVVDRRTRETVAGLLDGTRSSPDPQGESYALLLVSYCRHWNRSMPFMFEREGDFTELLIPANLLADESVLSRAVRVLTGQACEDVEVIGWLYQFYISERKDEVFAGFKKNKKAGAEEIPAASQLFTPHWIVRYLVENSLGRLWMLNHPSSRLVDGMDYYVSPVDEETDFLRISSPKELKIIDPACGSGHMLTYAFDLLYAIYSEEGYAPSEIPGLILANNLYGIEIDPRAGALAAFALTMKARARQRTYLNKRVEPNVCVLEPIKFTPQELSFLASTNEDRDEERAFWNQFENADTFGSLIEPNPEVTARFELHLSSLQDGGDLIAASIIQWAERVLVQANYLGPHYAVVIGNPPYMGTKNMGSDLVEFVKTNYPKSKADLFASFIERSLRLGAPKSLVGMVTMHTWMFLSSFEKLRDKILSVSRITSMAHLGTRAFDSIGGAVVATAAFVLTNRSTSGSGVFHRLVDGEDETAKRRILQDAIRGEHQGIRFVRQGSWFRTIPGAPISYWLEDGLVRSFAANRPLSDVATPRQGLATTDNGRFLRRWYEVAFDEIGFGLVSRAHAEESGLKWFPYNKGGSMRRWYGNQEFIVNWSRDGREIKENIVRKYPYLNGNPNFVAKNTDYYFRPSISWSLIGTGVPSFRYYPPGFVFDVAGTSVFPHNHGELEALLGYLNSGVTEALLAAIAPTMNLVGGDIARVPVPDFSCSSDTTQSVVTKLIELAKLDWDSSELSWGFDRSPLLEIEGTLRRRVTCVQEKKAADFQSISAFEKDLDIQFSREIGLDQVPLRQSDGDGQSAVTRDGRDAPAVQIVLDLLSFGIGCIFGRYSLDAPGLVLATRGGTLEDYLKKVITPVFMPDSDNVVPVVDGDWFEDDIVARFRQFLRVAFGERHFEENLRFIIETLDVKDLRDYFLKSFYADHVQRYKKRPIYWMFSSPKGSFNALIYMHRYMPTTASIVLNEYLREFKAKLAASLQHQERLAAGGGAARERAAALKETDRLRKVMLELDEYEHDVLYPLASQQVAIDLDDGVKVNYPKLGAALKKIPGLEAAE